MKRAYLLTALLLAAPAQGADRALLIGTTSYADPVYDLPGLELDIVEMERFARKLGFESDAIRTLSGTDVTVDNLQRVFDTFLTEGVSTDDALLIYYTGHGLQIADRNGDEADRRDEAISMYDLAPAARGWDGALVDDDFAAMLDALPSENIFVIVDACHSGTITRSIGETVMVDSRSWGDETLAVKSLPFRPDRTRSVAATPDTSASPPGVVTLSAAQDDEQSFSSSKGSLFTLALGESLANLAGEPTPRSLMDSVAALLDTRLDEKYRFRPNLTGDRSLFEKSIVLGARTPDRPVNRSDVEAIVSGLDPLPATLLADRYVDGDSIEFEIDAPADGWLNVIAVDADDALVLLYPNRHAPDNRVSAGTARLPGDAAFEWAAQPPWGETLVAVLYSPDPLNLLESSVQKARDGSPLVDYVLPSTAGLASLREGASTGRKAALLSVMTCARPGDCP